MASDPCNFTCNTCSLTFKTCELQRSHMRQNWHVTNIRRRIAGLPALSEDLQPTQITPPRIVLHSIDQDDAENTRHRCQAEFEPVPTNCLFCSLKFATLDANVRHMAFAHGLFIPSLDKLSDLESFLTYLAIVVFEYNECLYCGLTKPNVDAVQTHMRDKGHCMINMDAESELLDFWGLSGSSDGEDEGSITNVAIKLSATEMRLPSGAIINARSDTTQFRGRPGLAQSRSKSSQHRLKRAEARAAITPGEECQDAAALSQPISHAHSHDSRVAVRGELGLTGLPESTKRALMISEKKMKRREAIAKTAYRHAMEQQPQKTIYYKTENPVYQAG